MTKETHLKGGYITALLILPSLYNNFLLEYDFIYRIILLLVYLYFAKFGALVNDIDMRGSHISRRFPAIYKLFGKRFRHRGFTHSLIFVILVAISSSFIIEYTDSNIVFICLFAGLLAGIMSHICLDLITKEGIELFYPLKTNFSILPIKTSSKTEKLINKLLSVLVIFLIGYRFYIITL